MKLLSPHKRRPQAWQDWLCCALALQRRHLWQGGLLGCGTLVVSWIVLKCSSPLVPLLVALAGAPLILASFTLLAARADGRVLRLPAGPGAAWATVGRLVTLGVLSWLVLLALFCIGAAVVKILATLGDFQETHAGTAALPGGSTRDFSWHLTVAASLFVVAPMIVYLLRGCCFALTGWFLVPLLLDGRLSLLEGYLLAQQGEEANRSAVTRARILCIVLTLSIAFSGGFLGLIVLPLIGALQYVSYRDVFLGQRWNKLPEEDLSRIDVQPVVPIPSGGGLS